MGAPLLTLQIYSATYALITQLVWEHILAQSVANNLLLLLVWSSTPTSTPLSSLLGKLFHLLNKVLKKLYTSFAWGPEMLLKVVKMETILSSTHMEIYFERWLGLKLRKSQNWINHTIINLKKNHFYFQFQNGVSVTRYCQLFLLVKFIWKAITQNLLLHSKLFYFLVWTRFSS